MRPVMHTGLILGALITMLCPNLAAGQCTSSDRNVGQAVGYAGIWLQFHNVPSGALGSLRFGYGEWNHYSCYNGGFPGFRNLRRALVET